MARMTMVLSLAVLLCAVASSASVTHASDAPQERAPAFALRAVDQNDDSRVDVQIIVVAIAAGIVVGLGSAAYLLRRRLGLTKYDREAAEKALSHH